jgi:hypothetical protein
MSAVRPLFPNKTDKGFFIPEVALPWADSKPPVSPPRRQIGAPDGRANVELINEKIAAVKSI